MHSVLSAPTVVMRAKSLNRRRAFSMAISPPVSVVAAASKESSMKWTV